MQTIKCVMMQKDEEMLLEPWLRYHGYLFGFENLSVIDNGSTTPSVLAALSRYEKAGVKVYWQFKAEADYDRKGPIVTDVIRILDHQNYYDFVVPLDCDEFLALWQPTGLVCDRKAILDYFTGLPADQPRFRINNCLHNDPSRPGWYWPHLAQKGILRRRSVGVLDHGFHMFLTENDRPMPNCNLTHLHFHYKAFETLKEHSRRKLRGRVNLDNPDAVRLFTGGGAHLLRNLFSTEAEYYRQFNDYLTLYIPGFSNLMAALGIQNEMITLSNVHDHPKGSAVIRLPRDPTGSQPDEPGQILVLDPIAYRDANFDLAAAGENPLRHFVMLGHKEKRSLS